MSVPILLALSDMSTMAVLPSSAAFAVSPPSELISDALKLVTCVIYSLALTPAVRYASAAYFCTVPEASLNSVSTPPTACSYVAYASRALLPTPAKAATAVPTPASPTVATPFNAPTALPDMELIALHAASAPLLSFEPIADAALPAAPGICDSTPPTAPPTLRK